ncbi:MULTISPECIES: helix-turn-helix domain-containing protein [unclassified Ruegeria]|uniref:helix-turn-helix transcriptional regulator n=1 Tax=unclassified Ruegeria TaxID=2625375 RepID=UPI00147F4179|nr:MULTISPECIES: helix-turn-helix domain-containing protein [unclassified Ruegeria]
MQIIPDRLYTDHDVAAFCGVSVHSVRRWRANRTGPQYVRIGERKIRYRGADVLRWADGLPTGDVIENLLV